MRSQTLVDIASDRQLSMDDRDMAALLIAVCNDWPAPNLNDPSELVCVLGKEMLKALTLPHLMFYISRVSLAHDPWKAESMTSIIAFMQCSIKHGLPEDTPLGEAIEHFGRRCGRG